MWLSPSSATRRTSSFGRLQVFLTAMNASPLKAGMTISNEPGYYADGRFGIRIESIVLVREVKTLNNFGDKGFLGFECVTMCVFFPTFFHPVFFFLFFFLTHYNF